MHLHSLQLRSSVPSEQSLSPSHCQDSGKHELSTAQYLVGGMQCRTSTNIQQTTCR